MMSFAATHNGVGHAAAGFAGGPLGSCGKEVPVQRFTAVPDEDSPELEIGLTR